MGFQHYILPDGREAGYGVRAVCDHPDCVVLVVAHRVVDQTIPLKHTVLAVNSDQPEVRALVAMFAFEDDAEEWARQKNEPAHAADTPCCCTCVSHVADTSHPLTDGGRVIHQRGWVCLAPEFDGVFSGWTAHGLCEMWQSRPVTVAAPAGTRSTQVDRL
jgi:hypothetical protein